MEPFGLDGSMYWRLTDIELEAILLEPDHPKRGWIGPDRPKLPTLSAVPDDDDGNSEVEEMEIDLEEWRDSGRGSGAWAALSPEERAIALVSMSPADRAAPLAALSPEERAATLVAMKKPAVFQAWKKAKEQAAAKKAEIQSFQTAHQSSSSDSISWGKRPLSL